MANDIYSGLTQLGSATRLSLSPGEVVLERAGNQQKGIPHVVRFTAPEFTLLCPMTEQPDFAHLVTE